MVEIPRKINVSLCHKGIPLAGMLIRVLLGTTSKNSYTVILGPTDEMGIATLDREQIFTEADLTRNFALMDYVDIRECFSGRVEISVMGRFRIGRALGAFKLYSDFYPFPTGYEVRLKQALERVIELRLETGDLELKAESSNPDVRIVYKGLD